MVKFVSLMSLARITFILRTFFCILRYRKKPLLYFPGGLKEREESRSLSNDRWRDNFRQASKPGQSNSVCFCALIKQELLSDYFVGEVEFLLSDYLAGFVAFSGYENDVTFSGGF